MQKDTDTSFRKIDPYHLEGSIYKGRYSLDQFIEEGGMSIVYRGRDLRDESDIAIKILAPRLINRENQAATYLKLFHREVEIASKLRHPNIVTIYDSGIENQNPFIVMEWLEGRTLGEEIATLGRLELSRVDAILNQISGGLEAAHKVKVIHLDLKPNNIFIVSDLDGSERVKVIDFGLSRIMQSTLGTTISRVIGTPHYMAPEVFSNKVSKLSDIYSLGVITYEMLTGCLPFAQSQIFALIQHQVEHAPPSARSINKEVPELIDDLIAKSMSKNPKLRPRTARDFYEEFGRVLRSIPSCSPSTRTVKAVVYASQSPSFFYRSYQRFKAPLIVICLLLQSFCAICLLLQWRLGTDSFTPTILSAFIPVRIIYLIATFLFWLMVRSDKRALKRQALAVVLTICGPFLLAPPLAVLLAIIILMIDFVLRL